jgi:hypothetical protein
MYHRGSYNKISIVIQKRERRGFRVSWSWHFGIIMTGVAKRVTKGNVSLTSYLGLRAIA